MIEYYCDISPCHFLVDKDWCSYHECSIELMQRRRDECRMDVRIYHIIEMLMEPDE